MTTETAQVFTVELNQYGFMTKEQVEQIAAAMHANIRREYGGSLETRQERIADWLFHGTFKAGEQFRVEQIAQEWLTDYANPWSGPGREPFDQWDENDD